MEESPNPKNYDFPFDHCFSYSNNIRIMLGLDSAMELI